MHTREVLKSLIFITLSILAILILVHFSLESDFAKVNQKIAKGSDAGYRMKTKYYKEFYYPTKFKKNADNENILSLGYFTLNINNTKHKILIIKVSIKTKKEAIGNIMNNQSVIRNDVINSVVNIDPSNINPKRVSAKIKKGLNSRFKNETVEDVYFEEFIVQ